MVITKLGSIEFEKTYVNEYVKRGYPKNNGNHRIPDSQKPENLQEEDNIGDFSIGMMYRVCLTLFVLGEG